MKVANVFTLAVTNAERVHRARINIHLLEFKDGGYTAAVKFSIIAEGGSLNSEVLDYYRIGNSYGVSYTYGGETYHEIIDTRNITLALDSNNNASIDLEEIDPLKLAVGALTDIIADQISLTTYH